MFVCGYCGCQFERVMCQAHLRRNPPKYCSRKCRDLARTTRVKLVCRQCGCSFERKAYMEDWSRDRGPFCGFPCYAQWQKENTTGVDNPNYCAEAVSRDSLNYRTAQTAALDRDNHRCCLCGSGHRLHVHHIGDEDDHALGNLQTLCASCHRLQHPVPHGPDGKFVSSR